jgi:hypothetical protein
MIPTVTVGCPDIESCAAVNFEPFELTTSAATWDAARHRVVLVRGGTHTWTWDGARWSTFVAPTPTGTDSVSLAYDPALATDLVYGYPYRTGVWSDTVWKPVVTKGLQPIAGPIADDPQLGGVLLMANPIGVHAQPALIWRFTPGIAAP